MRTSLLRALGLLPALPVALALTCAVAHAGVRVVAPTGAPYAEIQAAVDVAEDGDVVLVKAGTYASFVIRNQEVAVVADAGANVQIEGSIRVAGVGATRTVLLRGLRATGTMTPSASTRHGLFARNCAGSLRVVGCQLTGLPLNVLTSETCYEGQGAYLENCADAAFVGCVLKGSEAPSHSPPYPGGGPGSTTQPHAGSADGGHGIFSDASTLTVYDSEARGGRSGFGGYFGGYVQCEPPPFAPNDSYLGLAGEGLRAQGTFVFASNASFVGAGGWNSWCEPGFCCICASGGGNALTHGGGATQGFLLACNLTAGQGGISGGYCPCGISIGACGWDCCPGTPVSCPAPSGLTLAGNVTSFTGSARRIVATPVVREGQLATLELHGQPGDVVELLVAERTGRQVLLGLRGVNLVRRSRPQLVQQVGTIGPSGVLTQTWPVGELGPGAESRTVWFQATMREAGGQTTLSSPAVIVLLDSAL